MNGTAILWTHALAALLFGVLALAQLRDRAATLPRAGFLIALSMSALWALAEAGIGPADAVTRGTESLRDIAWIAFLFAVLRRDPTAQRDRAVTTVYGVVVLVALTGMGLVAMPPAETVAGTDIANVALLLRMMVAVGALFLVHHLYSVVIPNARGGIRMAVIALATMWLADLVLYAGIYLTQSWPWPLLAARGLVMAAIVPMLAVAVHRNGDWTLKVSRTLTWQSLLLVALMAYAGIAALAIAVIGAIGGPYARIGQTAFVFGSAATLLALLASPRVKAWLRVEVAKHLFRHRYDYRAEWMRFTETLGMPGEGAAPIEERVVKAVADMTDSPAGLLLAAGEGVLTVAADWRWPGEAGVAGGDAALAAHLARTGRIIELDGLRAGRGSAEELAAVPQWMIDDSAGWALVPLIHVDALVGAILLARPPIDRALDWEDFDLLRVAGRQVASYLAEARVHAALAEARRFDEFNRRFAFILHDVKNLVSQLTLVARNAERHADNPAFRADMVATLNESAGRMTDLLARLSHHQRGGADAPAAIELMPMAERVARRSAGGHPVTVEGVRDAVVLADPARLDQALGHLIQNAAEASPPGAPVEVTVGRDFVQVRDRGAGMSAAFIRDDLFRPFTSTKPGGFGLGAFEARQIVQAMGGTLEVASTPGEGTRFTITLPAGPTAAGLDRAA